MNFTQEQIAKAKKANSVEELLALAKENGMEMTDDEAKKYFEQWHKEGELADEELDNVAGGGCGGDDDSNEPSFKSGDRVRVTYGKWKDRTGTSNGYDYTSDLAIMVWVTFDDNGKKESVNSEYLEHI